MKGSDYAVDVEAKIESATRGDRGFAIVLEQYHDNDDDPKAELTRIVTAVNAHDDLVEALAELVNYSSGCVVSPACGDCPHCRASAALAKAKGDTDGSARQ